MRRSLEELVVDLTSDQAFLRELAVRELAGLDGPEATDLLLAAVEAVRGWGVRTLADEDVPAVVTAVRALGRRGDARAVEAVWPFITWTNPELRGSAAEALALLGDARAVGPLLDVLSRSNAESRSAAAYALGELLSPEAVRPLIRSLGDPSAEVRDAAAVALTRLGEHRLVETVARMLGGRPPATEVDGREVVPLVRALGHPEREPLQLAARALAGVLPVAEDAIVEGMGEADEGERHRLTAGLAEVGAAIVPTLAALLERPEGLVRCIAVEALGLIGAPAVGMRDRLRAVARERDAASRELRERCEDALWRISLALSRAPAELEASVAPAGTGLEPEAAMPPPGRGTEPESAELVADEDCDARARRKWWPW